ncbi:MAG: sigma-70 family RNA polymerase sigma factor [Oscillospiraceae bacterium]|nr:sigma-70 family RNA polymerase sigma factor [Oscillospiraceae bacterium]
MDDQTIIALYWSRDQRALNESQRKYGPLCFRLSENILASREDAEECVSDTWLRAWDTMPPQKPDSLRAYLSRICRNLSLDRWRARRARKRGEGLEVLLEELEDCVPASPSAEAAAESREITRCIDTWLETLESEDRTAFLRRYWYGQQVKELARQTGCAPQKMAQRLYRLRQSLRRALEEEGITV